LQGDKLRGATSLPSGISRRQCAASPHLPLISFPPFNILQASVDKMREMLIVQLVQGYKLRELEVKKELKDRFWDQ
jgi:hypothetical protein